MKYVAVFVLFYAVPFALMFVTVRYTVLAIREWTSRLPR